MQADSDLAAHTSEVLHHTEGASPTQFEVLPDIPEDIENPSQPIRDNSLHPIAIPTLSFDGVLNKRSRLFRKLMSP